MMIKNIRTTISWIRILGLDAVIIALSWIGAFLIRFDGTVPPEYHKWLLLSPLVVLLRSAALFFYGVYWSPWRFTTVLDVWRILGRLALGVSPSYTAGARSTSVSSWTLSSTES